jgi:prolycopene isomerase
MFKDASFGYPRGGGRAIPGSFLESLKRNNGNIVCKEQVVNIVVENGIAVGVRTSDKVYLADIIISNTGISQTIELAGKENFPEDYASRAERNIYSNAYITVKYALRKPVIPYPVVFYMPDMPGPDVFNYIKDRSVPEDPYLFIPVPSNIDPTLAPPEQQLVIAGTAAPPGASKKLCDAIIEKVDKKVNQLFPDIKNAILWKLYSTAGDITGLTNHSSGACIGIGQIPGQVGMNRPGHETPIKNLWMVGADVGSRGIGTEIASSSALNLVNIIKQKY